MMVKISEIINMLQPVGVIGNSSGEVNNVIQLDPSNERTDALFWCNDKNLHKLKDCKKGVVLCSPAVKEQGHMNDGLTYILLSNPRQGFAKVVKTFFASPEPTPVISPRAVIHPTARIGKNVFIGDHTVIEKDCVIGDNCYIGYCNSILHGTLISDNVKIGSNNTIGGVGFGYEKSEAGDYEVVPHIGNVVIKSFVEIGNNTCIDRAVLGSTLIHEHVKIDNLVHVAHGVVIGRNSLIIAHAMLGGSAVIGENVWVAPCASIINKGSAEDDSLIGMGAVVVKPVKKGTIVAGNPAKYLKDV